MGLHFHNDDDKKKAKGIQQMIQSLTWEKEKMKATTKKNLIGWHGEKKQNGKQAVGTILVNQGDDTT